MLTFTNASNDRPRAARKTTNPTREDERPEDNFIRKHYLEMQARGVAREGASARLFSNPAGDFGSLVGDQV